MHYATVIEIIATVLGLIYLLLLIKENIWCWAFGILSSFLSIFLFVDAKLYSEALLYSYYVIIGVYGWSQWRKKVNGKPIRVKTWKWTFHLIAISIGLLLSYALGWFFSSQTDADRPYADAFSTIISFIASFMEAHKVLSGWIYWIVVNAFSVWLYFVKDLQIYAGLMVIYTIMSFVGLWQWYKSYRLEGQLNTQ